MWLRPVLGLWDCRILTWFGWFIFPHGYLLVFEIPRSFVNAGDAFLVNFWFFSGDGELLLAEKYLITEVHETFGEF